MLSKLIIQNYVLIEHLEMEPSEGLSIITGETGAGKSIMLGAVGLLLGNRADTKVLLSKSQKCYIEGLFDVSSYGLQYLFEERDLDYDSQTLIRREISASGKSRAFINDTPVRLDVLKEIGEKLLNVHSQNETFNLGEQSYQLKLLDSYAGNGREGISYQNSYTKYIEVNNAYLDLLTSAQSIQKDLDYTQFIFTELDELNPISGEQESLEEELRVIEHAEEIKSNLFQVNNSLSESEQSILGSLSEASSLLKKISSFSTSLKQLSDRLESNIIDLADLQKELDQEQAGIEYNPDKASEVNDRLSEIYRLQQKHSVNTVEELILLKDELSNKLLSASTLDDEIDNADQLRKECLALTNKLGEDLSQSRNSISDELCRNIEQVLIDLSIPDAKIIVDFERVDPGISGLDLVTFKFSANKGIAPEILKKTASGGEFSRLMFAVKYLMAGKTALPTIIFDEIDTGVSGEVAKRLGQQMKLMGEKHQILTITHLPQIAAMGESHYYAYKKSNDESTASNIRLLSEAERIDEIAKMIAGDNPSLSAIESARELVRS